MVKSLTCNHCPPPPRLLATFRAPVRASLRVQGKFLPAKRARNIYNCICERVHHFFCERSEQKICSRIRKDNFSVWTTRLTVSRPVETPPRPGFYVFYVYKLRPANKDWSLVMMVKWSKIDQMVKIDPTILKILIDWLTCATHGNDVICSWNLDSL